MPAAALAVNARPFNRRSQTQLLRSPSVRFQPLDITGMPLPDLVYRLYARRWLLLVLFALLNVCASLVCFTFVPVQSSATLYFGNPKLPVEALVPLFLLGFIPALWPSIELINNFGLRRPLLLGAWILVAGAMLRIFPNYIDSAFYRKNVYNFVVGGQILAGLSQALLVQQVKLFSFNWFGPCEQRIVHSLLHSATFLGIGAAYLITTRVFTGDYQSLERLLNLYSWPLMGVAFLISVYFPSFPPSPPSYAVHLRLIEVARQRRVARLARRKKLKEKRNTSMLELSLEASPKTARLVSAAAAAASVKAPELDAGSDSDSESDMSQQVSFLDEFEAEQGHQTKAKGKGKRKDKDKEKEKDGMEGKGKEKNEVKVRTVPKPAKFKRKDSFYGPSIFQRSCEAFSHLIKASPYQPSVLESGWWVAMVVVASCAQPILTIHEQLSATHLGIAGACFMGGMVVGGSVMELMSMRAVWARVMSGLSVLAALTSLLWLGFLVSKHQMTSLTYRDEVWVSISVAGVGLGCVHSICLLGLYHTNPSSAPLNPPAGVVASDMPGTERKAPSGVAAVAAARMNVQAAAAGETPTPGIVVGPAGIDYPTMLQGALAHGVGRLVGSAVVLAISFIARDNQANAVYGLWAALGILALAGGFFIATYSSPPEQNPEQNLAFTGTVSRGLEVVTADPNKSQTLGFARAGSKTTKNQNAFGEIVPGSPKGPGSPRGPGSPKGPGVLRSSSLDVAKSPASKSPRGPSILSTSHGRMPSLLLVGSMQSKPLVLPHLDYQDELDSNKGKEKQLLFGPATGLASEAQQRMYLEETLFSKSSSSDLSSTRSQSTQVSGLTSALLRASTVNSGSNCKDRASHNVLVFGLKFSADIDLDKLRWCLRSIINAHDVLRTVLTMDEERGIVQTVQPPVALSDTGFPMLMSVELESTSEEALDNFLRNESMSPFDLHTGPVIRFHVIRDRLTSSTSLVISVHHIAFDGTSIGLLFRELSALYHGKNDRDFTTAPASSSHVRPQKQYLDYAAWERDLLQRASFQDSISYWERTLAGTGSALLEMPLDRPRPANRHNTLRRAEQVNFLISSETARGIDLLKRQTGATTFQVLLAAYKLLLHKWCNQVEINVGSATDTRSLEKEFAPLVGFFANTVVYRSTIDPKASFENLVKQVKKTAEDVKKHQGVPFNMVVEKLVGADRDLSVSPFFQAVFLKEVDPASDHLRWDSPSSLSTPLTTQYIPLTFYIAQFDLIASFVSTMLDDGTPTYKGFFSYATDIFDRNTISKLVQRWSILLDQLFLQPAGQPLPALTTPVASIPCLLDAEIAFIKNSNQSQKQDFGTPRCIGDFFTEVAQKYPHKPAVNFEGSSLTYAEFYGTCYKLALFLQQNCGVGPNKPVAISMERSVEMVVGIFGIILAGGTYCVIPHDDPADRRAFLLKDSRAVAVLTMTRLAGLIKPTEFSGKVVSLDDTSQWLMATSASNQLKQDVTPNDVAYFIYTSGSTGAPKCVMVSHRAYFNFHCGTIRFLKLDPSVVSIQMARNTFDAHIIEFFSTIMIGGTLVMLRPGGNLDFDYLTQTIEATKATFLILVPSHGAHLLEEVRGADLWHRMTTLKYFGFGGEALSPSLVKLIKSSLHDVHVINYYGPAECTVSTHLHDCEDRGALQTPLGKPLPNYECFVLDRQHNLAPVGTIGHLHVGGPSVFEGYQGRDDLTRKALVYREIPEAGWKGLLYDTGDLVRYLPDGDLVFMGRDDFQVKIRGQRLELGEIEETLRRHPDVSNAAVMKREDKPGQVLLAAYLLLRPNRKPNEEGYRKFCEEHLASYMVPSVFKVVDKFPLSANGKINLKALPVPSSGPLSRDKVVPPKTDMERELRTIWAEFLTMKPNDISTDLDFFSTGANSLMAARMVSRLRKDVCFSVSMVHLFKHRTIQDLARVIDEELGGSVHQSDSMQVLVESEDGLQTEFPLSQGQRRLYFEENLVNAPNKPKVSHNNMVFGLKFEGPLNPDQLESAINSIAKRHELLRTTLHDEGTSQRVEAHVSIPLQRVVAKSSDAVQELLKQEAKHWFDLAQIPQIRAFLVQTGKLQYSLCICVHHIVFDGTSIGLFFKELAKLYNRQDLAPLPMQYGKYASWETDQLHTKEMDAALEYWVNKLQGTATYVMDMPLDRPRAQNRRLNIRDAEQVDFEIAPEVMLGVESLKKQLGGGTTFQVLLGVWQLLMSRWCNQHDMCTGSAIDNRSLSQSPGQLQGMIGFFVNTVIYRTNVDPKLTFAELMKDVQRTAQEVKEHQQVPFNLIVEKLLGSNRDLTVSPFFQAAFLKEVDYEVDLLSWMDASSSSIPVTSTMIPLHFHVAQFDLIGSFRKRGDGKFDGYVSYATDIFDRQTIRTLVERWSLLLHRLFVENMTSVPVKDIPLLLEAEKVFIARTLDTKVDFGPQTCIGDVFQTTTQQFADKTAVVLDNVKLTYSEFHAEAEKLALFLQRKCDIQPNQIVCLCLERSVELAVGIMGTVLAGGVYCALPPDDPADRREFLLQDTRATAVVTVKKFASFFGPQAPYRGEVIYLDSDYAEGTLGSHDKRKYGSLERRAEPKHVAYLIYTSGSTGKPKCVMVSHRAYLNFYHGSNKVIGFDPSLVCVQVARNTFDAHIIEFFSTLMLGGTLVMLKPGGNLDFDYFSKTIETTQATSIIVVPSHGAQFVEDLESEKRWPRLRSLKYFGFGGEALSPSLVTKIKTNLPGVEVVNYYGPAECTVSTHIHLCESGNVLQTPLGPPLPNYQCLVLDRNGSVAPVGATGYLYVGGPSVFEGYLGRQDLTDKVIATHDLKEIGFNGPLYFTGDLVKYLPNGYLVFMGRDDFQVKIRGQRLELGEIEETLRQHPAVASAAVLKREDRPGQPMLVAYVVRHKGRYLENQSEQLGQLDNALKAELVKYLSGHLAAYMVPSAFVFLSNIPLSANGKVNRASLPAPVLEVEQVVAPRTATEKRLVAIWSEFVPPNALSINSDVFSLGTDSLMAARIISRIKKEFGAEVNIAHMFQNRTISALAKLVDEIAPVVRPSGDMLTICGLQQLKASRAQQRMFLEESMVERDPSVESVSMYNIVFGVRLRGALRQDHLVAAIEQVVRRHEILRTLYAVSKQDGLLQTVHPDTRKAFTFTVVQPIDISLDDFLMKEVCWHFDLEQGPLIRFHLIKDVDPNAHTLVMAVHHIAFDGVSMSLFLHELCALYGQRKLPLPPIQYSDYSLWEAKALETPQFEKSLTYWEEKLADSAQSILELPLDRPRGATRRLNVQKADHCRFELSSSVVRGIEELKTRTGSTTFQVLLATFNVLLAKWCNCTEMSVGSVIDNRAQRWEFENLIGFFVNTLVYRCELDPVAQNFEDLLKKVTQTALEAHEHQGVPFDMLVQRLVTKRDLSVAPFFQVMFLLDIRPDNLDKLGEAECELVPVKDVIAQFDLTLLVSDSGDGKMSACFQFAPDVFDRKTISNVARRWDLLLHRLFEQKQTTQKLKDLSLLLDEEVHFIRDFNNTNTSFGPPMCVGDMFVETALANPQRTAIFFEGIRVSYMKLLTSCRRLAIYLQYRAGISRNHVVILCVERSIELEVGLLGTFMSGGVYCPCRPDDPPDRLKFLIEDTGCKVVLTMDKFAHLFTDMGVHVVRLDKDYDNKAASEQQLQQTGQVGGREVEKRCSPQDLAYLVYTSGSTGKPKCVMVSHQAFFNHYHGLVKFIGYTPSSRVINMARVTFDAHITELLVPVLIGGILIVLKPGGNLDFDYISQLIERTKATYLELVPSMGAVFLKQLESKGQTSRLRSLRHFGSGGEALPGTLVREINRLVPTAKVLNCYGPAECTIGAVFHKCTVKDQEVSSVSIGRPLSNYQCYVLDRSKALAPVGTVGHLYIGGRSLFSGYLKREDITNKVLNKHSLSEVQFHGVLYYTGDLVRHLPDGDLVFVGRDDFQVKLRGQRLELGEIEETLRRHSAVTQAIVIKREDTPGRPMLVAYLGVGEKRMQDKQSMAEFKKRMTQYCERSLPPYMVPSAFVLMKELPLTSNLKIDRKKLPPPEQTEVEGGGKVEEAASETEKKLVEIWKEYLSLPEVSVTADFFNIGGDSLLAAQMVVQLRADVSSGLSVVHIFQHRTITAMAKFVDTELAGQAKQESTDHMFPCDLLTDAQLPPGFELAPISAEEQAEEDELHNAHDYGDEDEHKSGEDEEDGIEGDEHEVQVTIHQMEAPKQQRVCFITGATGFLGIHLLDQLLDEDSQFSLVYCLVRANDEATGHMRLRDVFYKYELHNALSPKLKVVLGDLAKPTLGTTPAVWDELCRNVDVIVHNGANVNFILPYSAMKPANVGGTTEVLKMAVAYKNKRVAYVSTQSMLGASMDEGPGGTKAVKEQNGKDRHNAGALDTLERYPLSIDHNLPLHTGYAQSKWVAERMMHFAAAKGLSVSVFRPSLVIGTRDKGIMPTNYFYLQVFKAFAQMGCGLYDNRDFQMIPVDECAQAIIELSLIPNQSPALANSPCVHGNLVVCNLAGPQNSTAGSWTGISSHMKSHGYAMQVVPARAWCEVMVTQAQAVGMNHALSMTTRTMQDALSFAEDLGGGVAFDIIPTHALAKSVGMVFSPIGEEHMHNCFHFLIKEGKLPHPRNVMPFLHHDKVRLMAGATKEVRQHTVVNPEAEITLSGSSKRNLPHTILHLLGMAVNLLLFIASFAFSYVVSYIWFADWPEFFRGAASLAGFGIALLGSGLVMKWLLIGRYRAGKHKMDSFFFFRWWLVKQWHLFLNQYVIPIFRGTPFMGLWLRLLGARIGRNVDINTTLITEPDLLHIGEYSVLEPNSIITGHVLQDGWLFLGHVYIPPDSLVKPNVTVVPAIVHPRHGTGEMPDFPKLSRGTLPERSFGMHALFLAWNTLELIVFAEFIYWSSTPIFLLVDWVNTHWGRVAIAALIPSFMILYNTMYFFFVVLIKPLLLVGCLHPGIHPRLGWFDIRLRYLDRLLYFSAGLGPTMVFLGTPVMAFFYRLLGCKVASSACLLGEPTLDVALVRIGAKCHMSSGVGLRTRFINANGELELANIDISDECFVGLNSVIDPHVKMEPGSTLAASSMAMEGTTIPTGTTWIGRPAQQFGTQRATTAVRQTSAQLASILGTPKYRSISQQNLLKPRLDCVSCRHIIHGLAMVMVIVVLSLMLFPSVLVVWKALEDLKWYYALAVMVFAHNLFGFLAAVGAIIVKRTLVRFDNKQQHEKQSMGYVKWLVFGLLLRLVDTLFLRHISGTRFMLWWYRGMGANMGHESYVSNPAIIEAEMLDVGSYSVVGDYAALVCHSFDSGYLEFRPIIINDFATVGAGCVILTDVSLEDMAVLQPGSLALPYQEFDLKSVWKGNIVRCLYQPPKAKDPNASKSSEQGEGRGLSVASNASASEDQPENVYLDGELGTSVQLHHSAGSLIPHAAGSFGVPSLLRGPTIQLAGTDDEWEDEDQDSDDDYGGNPSSPSDRRKQSHRKAMKSWTKALSSSLLRSSAESSLDKPLLPATDLSPRRKQRIKARTKVKTQVRRSDSFDDENQSINPHSIN